MYNRNDLIVDCRLTPATATGERIAAMAMSADLALSHQKTLGAEPNSDQKFPRGECGAARR
jgi:hypothetical protein